jgi:hypothetical protein
MGLHLDNEVVTTPTIILNNPVFNYNAVFNCGGIALDINLAVNEQRKPFQSYFSHYPNSCMKLLWIITNNKASFYALLVFLKKWA